MKRSYRTQEEIGGDIERILSGLRRSGKEFFPSERELCAKVNASRETVRRVLESLEERGALIKGPKGRVLAPASKSGPRALFVAAGVDIVANRAWNRLWTHLSQLAERTEINLSLCLLGWQEPEKELARYESDPPDCVICANTPTAEARKRLMGLRGKATLITVDEQHEDACDYTVCLDNFEAGRLAGEALLAAGYRKPAYLGWMHNPPYQPFIKRGDGFLAALKSAGLKSPRCVQWLKCREDSRVDFTRNLIRMSESIARMDFDSLFCHSDEGIDFVCEIISERHRVPEDFGLISVAGSGEAAAFNPPMSYVSHADRETAEALLALLESIRLGSPHPKKTTVVPELHHGKTLRA